MNPTDPIADMFHKNIETWRRQQSILLTGKRRPDLLEKAELTEQERVWLKEKLL